MLLCVADQGVVDQWCRRSGVGLFDWFVWSWCSADRVVVLSRCLMSSGVFNLKISGGVVTKVWVVNLTDLVFSCGADLCVFGSG